MLYNTIIILVEKAYNVGYLLVLGLFFDLDRT